MIEMMCCRCGSEITETYQKEHFNCVYGPTWRTNTAFAKLNIWQPEQGKSDKPDTIVLCPRCYEEFVDFLEV